MEEKEKIFKILFDFCDADHDCKIGYKFYSYFIGYVINLPMTYNEILYVSKLMCDNESRISYDDALKWYMRCIFKYNLDDYKYSILGWFKRRKRSSIIDDKLFLYREDILEYYLLLYSSYCMYIFTICDEITLLSKYDQCNPRIRKFKKFKKMTISSVR